MTETKLTWIDRQLAYHGIPPLAEPQRRCFTVLSSIAQPYNLPLIGAGWAGVKTGFDPIWHGIEDEPKELAPLRVTSTCVIARLRGELATFDGPELSVLVNAAHRLAVRVSLSAELYDLVDHDSTYVDGTHPVYPSSCLRVLLHPRDTQGPLTRRHPGLSTLAAYGENLR